MGEGGGAADATASAILAVVAWGLEEGQHTDQGSTQGRECVGVAREHDDDGGLLGRRRRQRLVVVEAGVVVVEWRGASTRARASWPITPQLPRAQRARAASVKPTVRLLLTVYAHRFTPSRLDSRIAVQFDSIQYNTIHGGYNTRESK